MRLKPVRVSTFFTSSQKGNNLNYPNELPLLSYHPFTRVQSNCQVNWLWFNSWCMHVLVFSVVGVGVSSLYQYQWINKLLWECSMKTINASLQFIQPTNLQYYFSVNIITEFTVVFQVLDWISFFKSSVLIYYLNYFDFFFISWYTRILK